MGKVKAAAVLGGLMCALLVLSTWAVASGNVSFALLQGAFQRACLEHPTPPGGSPQGFADACVFIARILKTLPPSTTPPTPEQLQAAAATGIAASKVPCDCEECIQFVSDIEAVMATNGTAAEITDVFAAACDARYTDPATVAQCRQLVSAVSVPQAIDFVLANYPPQVVCQVVQACPSGTTVSQVQRRPHP